MVAILETCSGRRPGLASPCGLRELAGVVAMAAGPARTAPPVSGGRWAPQRPSRGRTAAQAADPEQGARVQALVELAKGGDADAFGQLYSEHVDAVYRYVLVRTGSPQVAEDITSETFLRALRSLGTFTWQGRDIAAWFVTIARNLVTDHHRSGRSRLEVSTDLLLGDAPAPRVPDGPAPAAPRDTEEAVLQRERDARLVAAIRQLRPEQQECLVLRFFHEFSLAETAEVLGRSEGAVKQLQLRSVRALARLLEEDGP